MSKRETYRLGTFLDDDDRPSLEELANALDGEFIERDDEELDNGEELVYKDKGRNVRVEQGGEEYDFCHFRYVSDTKESYRVRTDDDQEDDANETRLETSRVLYFENGQFAFESNQDLEDAWIPRFIGRATGYDIEGTDYQFYTLGENYMAEAYKGHEIVTKLKLMESRTSDEISDEVGEFIRDLAGQVTSFEFSSGGDENLKQKPSIDKCARNLAIGGMNAKHEEELMKEFSGSSLTQTLDYEDVQDNMEEKIRRESLAARDVVQEELERLSEVYD